MKHCDLCGSPVKVCGKLTLHYEPNLPSEEEIEKIIEDNLYYQDCYDGDELICESSTIAREISKRLRVE